MERLDGIDHAQLRSLRLERRQHRVQVGLGDHGNPQRRFGLQPLGPEPDLRGRLLGRDVQRPPSRGEHVGERHRRERRLPDPRRAADQYQRTGNDPAAEHGVELADPGAEPFVLGGVDIREHHRLGGAGAPGTRAAGRAGPGAPPRGARARLLHQRVPLSASPAPALPPRRLVAAGRADEDRGCARHPDEAKGSPRRDRGRPEKRTAAPLRVTLQLQTVQRPVAHEQADGAAPSTTGRHRRSQFSAPGSERSSAPPGQQARAIHSIALRQSRALRADSICWRMSSSSMGRCRATHETARSGRFFYVNGTAPRAGNRCAPSDADSSGPQARCGTCEIAS